MKKNLLSAFALLCMAASVFAQTDQAVKDAAKPQEVKIEEDTAHHYWKKGAFLGVNFGQAALFNWAAGGQNTISLQVNANGFLNYAKGHMAWDNTLNFSLGGIVQGHVLGHQGIRPAAFRKNVDQLQITSRLGYVIDKKKQWMAALLADCKTSVMNGYDYTAYDANASVTDPQRISSPFSPTYVVVSLGINYKPAPFVSFYLSPVAGKLSFLDGSTTSYTSAKNFTDSSKVVDATRYGFKPTQTLRGQMGAYFRVDFQKDIMKNVNLKTSLELFTPYTNEIIKNDSASGDQVLYKKGVTQFNTVGKIDVNWLTGINFKVNKYITCSLEWQLIYSYSTLVPRYNYSDGSIEKRYNSVQFREGFTLGFGYKFAEKTPKPAAK